MNSANSYWKNIRDDDMSHYTVFSLKSGDGSGMDALRSFFPDAKVDDMNLILFSTSGVHGSYLTIEDVEGIINNKNEDNGEPEVTFLIIQPRRVTLRYGQCIPKNADDIAFLKKLREDSHKVIATIGL